MTPGRLTRLPDTKPNFQKFSYELPQKEIVFKKQPKFATEASAQLSAPIIAVSKAPPPKDTKGLVKLGLLILAGAVLITVTIIVVQKTE